MEDGRRAPSRGAEPGAAVAAAGETGERIPVEAADCDWPKDPKEMSPMENVSNLALIGRITAGEKPAGGNPVPLD
jgi:hypothetical protein